MFVCSIWCGHWSLKYVTRFGRKALNEFNAYAVDEQPSLLPSFSAQQLERVIGNSRTRGAMTLLNLEMQTLHRPDTNDLGDEEPRPQKRWTAYMPLLGMSNANCREQRTEIVTTGVIGLILLPQPSILILCTRYYLLIQDNKPRFLFHLGVSYTICFMMLCSLIVCLARDPGSAALGNGSEQGHTSSGHQPVPVEEEEDSEDEISLGEALMRARPTASSNTPRESSNSLKARIEPRWCRKVG